MNSEEKMKVLENLKSKIKESCTKSKYKYLCNKISTDSGMAWVMNRSITLMSNDGFKLSSALAYLETELEENQYHGSLQNKD